MSALRRLAFTVVLGVLGGTMALPTVTQAAENRTYVVANGDTLFGIASQSGIRLSELLRANDPLKTAKKQRRSTSISGVLNRIDNLLNREIDLLSNGALDDDDKTDKTN